MYIREITIGRFRHLRDVEIGPFPAPPSSSDIIALAGANGSGKSSVLELLGRALSNSWSLTWQIRRTFPESSFEVCIGLTPQEMQLVREHHLEVTGLEEQALDRLGAEGRYYRSFDFPEGEYSKDEPMQNQMHSLVTSALRKHHQRSLGFFLRSDRAYPSKSYDIRKLRNAEKRHQIAHMWTLAFNTSDVQYEDMYEYLVEQRYSHDRRLGAFHRRKTKGEVAGEEEAPEDPLLPYEILLARLFPGYAFGEAEGNVPKDLMVKLPSGLEVPFPDLSSGEKEVFFILSFFLRHQVSDAIIVIDEPELHLHPELARQLLRTMQEIRPGNQIWVATHNAEVIDETGADRVYYLWRDPQTWKAKAVAGTRETEGLRMMRELFGLSGYVGVAKAMVFLEGAEASVDRKVFSRLIRIDGGAVRLIPAGGHSSLPRINRAVLRLVEETFSWCEFFLIRDRDYLTEDMVEKYEGEEGGRLFVLDRHQIENYLLNESHIADVERELFDHEITPEQSLNDLRACARQISGQVLRDMVSFRLNLLFRPQDFSLGNMFEGQEVFGPAGEMKAPERQALFRRLKGRVGEVTTALDGLTSDEGLELLVDGCITAVGDAIRAPDDGWRRLFPGKLLLKRYAWLRAYGDTGHTVLINALVKRLSEDRDSVPPELRRILELITSAGERSEVG
jgi:energy-coupling factor transporter ATP-binding protein EcfA2